MSKSWRGRFLCVALILTCLAPALARGEDRELLQRILEDVELAARWSQISQGVLKIAAIDPCPPEIACRYKQLYGYKVMSNLVDSRANDWVVENCGAAGSYSIEYNQQRERWYEAEIRSILERAPKCSLPMVPLFSEAAECGPLEGSPPTFEVSKCQEYVDEHRGGDPCGLCGG